MFRPVRAPIEDHRGRLVGSGPDDVGLCQVDARGCVGTGTGESPIKIGPRNTEKDRHIAVSDPWLKGKAGEGPHPGASAHPGSEEDHLVDKTLPPVPVPCCSRVQWHVRLIIPPVDFIVITC